MGGRKPRLLTRQLLSEIIQPRAEEILQETPIDLVITDIRMPKKTGVDLLQWTKSSFPETEVIILTGYSDLNTAMKAVEQGAFDFDDVVTAICDKMVRRHPHVFEDVSHEDEAALRHAWEQHKQREREANQLEIERLRDDTLKLTVDSEVSFDFGEADIKPAFRPSLDKLTDLLLKYDRTIVHIVGHTDSVGSDDFNQRLSEERAQRVGDYLAAYGVPRERLRTEGRGEREVEHPRREVRQHDHAKEPRAVAQPFDDPDAAGGRQGAEEAEHMAGPAAPGSPSPSAASCRPATTRLMGLTTVEVTKKISTVATAMTTMATIRFIMPRLLTGARISDSGTLTATIQS